MVVEFKESTDALSFSTNPALCGEGDGLGEQDVDHFPRCSHLAECVLDWH